VAANSGGACWRLRTLGSILVTVHHIGSTAVPGLAAKPIIDLMPLVDDLGNLDRESWRVEALGYNWHGELGISGRRYCTLSDAVGLRIVQLHFFEAHSREVVRHIAFRDYLRAHPEATIAYEKKNAAHESFTPTIPTPTPTRRLRGCKIWRSKQSRGSPNGGGLPRRD
jgi:GrpB-like predicted nucleotidyltransferase (UPF0157 family)